MPSIRLAILLATYLLIAIQQFPGAKLNRPAASLLGAVAMVTIGGLPLSDAYAAIDMDVIVSPLGVLLLTGFLELGGFFEWVAGHIVARTHSPRALFAAIVGSSGLLSAFFANDTVSLSNLVSNVPAVLLWLPVVSSLPDALFVWMVMAKSSTFAGNLTLFGSMANLIVAEGAEARGTRIAFLDYLRVGLPVTVLTIAWGSSRW